MIDINKIYDMVKVERNDELTKSFEEHIRSMQFLFEAAYSHRGQSIRHNKEELIVVKQVSEYKTSNMDVENVLSNGQVKGLYFRSNRSVSE